MADRRCFVQFSHPGSEHTHDRGRAWHMLSYDHMRKLMQLRGQWIAEDGGRQTGDLLAWGEWEPESDLLRKLNPPPEGDPQYPRYLWRPYYVPKDSYLGLHNTDPFIFGQRFLYSNCRQVSKRGPTRLTQLDVGSVIAFGSGRRTDGEWRWLLDTVLVVRDFVPYSAHNARIALKDWVPAAFMDVTAGPLTDNAERSIPGKCASTREQLRLYRGATPDDPVDGMFSFVPASPAGGDSGFPRPLINLPAEYFNPAAFRGPNGLRHNRTSEELRDLWDRLVAQIRDAGLVLGTHAELPERRREQSTGAW